MAALTKPRHGKTQALLDAQAAAWATERERWMAANAELSAALIRERQSYAVEMAALRQDRDDAWRESEDAMQALSVARVALQAAGEHGLRKGVGEDGRTFEAAEAAIYAAISRAERALDKKSTPDRADRNAKALRCVLSAAEDFLDVLNIEEPGDFEVRLRDAIKKAKRTVAQ